MNENNNENHKEENKVMGLTANNYVTYMYYALLASAAIGLVSMVLVMVGITFLGSIGGLAGLVGFVMALLGLFVFANKFNAVQVSHFKYLLIISVAFTVLSMILGFALGMLGAIMISIVGIVMSLIYVLVLFSCYKLWNDGTALSPDTIKAKSLNLIGK